MTQSTICIVYGVRGGLRGSAARYSVVIPKTWAIGNWAISGQASGAMRRPTRDQFAMVWGRYSPPMAARSLERLTGPPSAATMST